MKGIDSSVETGITSPSIDKSKCVVISGNGK